MAIISKNQLPVVLKVNSEPLKLHILSQLGHPNVLVELNEVQFESILRSTGDFIARYFPKEEKYAAWMTTPLKSEYEIPSDAYLIRKVSWDPVTTRIDDIFGAESYLFSFADGTMLMTENGPMLCSEDNKNIKLTTPFGKAKPLIRWNEKKQPGVTICTKYDKIECTINHPVKCNGDYITASECQIGDALENIQSEAVEITSINKIILDGTWSVQTKHGCYYASGNGDDFYLVH